MNTNIHIILIIQQSCLAIDILKEPHDQIISITSILLFHDISVYH